LPADFRLYENGVLQRISYFSQDELPLSVVFLFDLTDSVRPVLKPLAEGAYKDAVSAGLQLAKVEYQVEGEVSGALANLTAAEIAEVKKRIEALALENSKPVEVPKGPVN